METKPTYEEIVKALEELVTHARVSFPQTPYRKALDKAKVILSHAKDGC